MSYAGSQPFKISLKAGGDLSALQFYFVKLNSAGDVVAVTGATDKPVGVLQNKPTSGQAAEIVVLGQTKLSADAATAIADQVGTSADGQAVALIAGTDTTKYVVGVCLETAAGAAVIFSALVNCANPHRAA